MKTLLAAAAAAMSLAAPALAEPPPAAAFGRIPAVVQVAISPSGQKLAILGGADKQRQVSIATIDQPGLPTAMIGDFDTMSLRWVGDDYVLVRIGYWDHFGPRGIWRFERHLALTPDAKLASSLLGKDINSRFLLEEPLLAVTASPPRAYMLGLVESTGAESDMNTHIQRKGVDNPFTAALMRVDPATGLGQVVERGDFDTQGWDLDTDGQPRVRVEVDSLNHTVSVLGKAKGASRWTTVWSGGALENGRDYRGYSASDDAIYLIQGDRLVRKKLDGGEIAPVGSPTRYSPILVWDHNRNGVVGVQSGGETFTTEWLDPDLGSVDAALHKVFPGKLVNLEQWSADRNRYVVRISGPDSPGVWYLFDRTRKEVSPLGEEYPELKGVQLGTRRWITYKAADGLEIPAYVTLPPGAPAHAGKLPLIVLPHGGPAARDDDDFDFLAQFLATRGYAVLQPEFRGSTGFGKHFEDAGRGEWGDKMQTDLLDGIAALAATGDIDPRRVCIVGASFGGYAALAGATLHPASYRCAASIAGVSSLGQLSVEQGRSYGRDSAAMKALRTMLGEAAPAKLLATSPANLAAAVSAPILLIHGDKDTVVLPEQSELMAQALKAAGKPYQYVVLKDEDHYLMHGVTRTETLQVLGDFLARNLPVS